jgi:hypothetical protein
LARVDFAPDTDGGMESMLGFRQDLGFAGAVQSVAAIAIHPEIEAAENEGAEGANDRGGLEEAADRTWENLNLGDAIEAEVGSTQVIARFAGGSSNTVAAALPFASVGWREGKTIVRYQMATVVPGPQDADETAAQTWLPRVSVRDGKLVLEHGLHQEIGWERRTDRTGMNVALFADQVANPVLEAMGHFANGNPAMIPSTNSFLFDRSSRILRAAGSNYATAGLTASLMRQLPGGNLIRISYASGGALAMPVASHPVSMDQAIAAARPRHAQMYALSLSGTLEGTGTRWRASYRWQPEDTVTRVAPYSADAIEPYLNLHIRQPIHTRRDGVGGIEALLDLRNLLAEGYRPFLLSDGSLLVFGQDQRGIQGGLAFTF